MGGIIFTSNLQIKTSNLKGHNAPIGKKPTGHRESPRHGGYAVHGGRSPFGCGLAYRKELPSLTITVAKHFNIALVLKMCRGWKQNRCWPL